MAAAAGEQTKSPDGRKSLARAHTKPVLRRHSTASASGRSAGAMAGTAPTPRTVPAHRASASGRISPPRRGSMAARPAKVARNAMEDAHRGGAITNNAGGHEVGTGTSVAGSQMQQVSL